MEKLKTGGVYTGIVEGYSSEGLGIVRLDGAVVFVPRAVRGETVDLRITKVMKTAAAGEIVTSLLSFITAPTSALILIVMGYQLHVSKKLLRPVLTTMGLRLGVLAVVCAAVSGILFAIIPYDKPLLLALIYPARAVHHSAVRRFGRRRGIRLHHAVAGHGACRHAVFLPRGVQPGITEFRFKQRCPQPGGAVFVAWEIA